MRPTRRSVAGLTLVAIVCCTALAVNRPAAPNDPIGPASYCRIRAGMTRDEVRAMVGRPPGLYYSRQRGPLFHVEEPTELWGVVDPPEGAGVKLERWWGDWYFLGVYFDRDGKVVGAQLGTIVPYPSFIDRVRLWLIAARCWLRR